MVRVGLALVCFLCMKCRTTAGFLHSFQPHIQLYLRTTMQRRSASNISGPQSSGNGLAGEDASADLLLRSIVANVEAETIRSFTRGQHHCAWKADPYVKTPECPNKAHTNRLFTNACAAAAAEAGRPISTGRFLVLDAPHAATSAALAELGANRNLIFAPNLYPATVCSLRAAGVTAWLGDVRTLLLHDPPPPPFLGIYLDACGSIKRYAPSILRILGISAAADDRFEQVAPLLVLPDGNGVGGGVLAITLDHRDPQEPGRDALDSLFALVADAPRRGGVQLRCLTVAPPAGLSEADDSTGSGLWVRENSGSMPGEAFSYDGMFFALFRVK